MKDLRPMLVGGALGLAIGGYAFVYAPMARNYSECGRITLCAPSGGETTKIGSTEGESPVGNADAPKD